MAEPVTLAEVKKYIREDEDYDYNDDLLSSLITAERIAMERQLGIIIMQREVTEAYRKPCCGQYNYCGYALQNVPVGGDVVIKDLSGNTVEFDNIGTDEYPVFKFTYSTNLTFTAGYDEVPEDLKLALKLRVATAYMQRENFSTESINKVPNNSNELMKTYNRNPF